VRQVGYLQELNRDARSTEHKKHKSNLAYNSAGGGGKSTMGIRYSHDSVLRPVKFFFPFFYLCTAQIIIQKIFLFSLFFLLQQ
jgi:hypothetical protein